MLRILGLRWAFWGGGSVVGGQRFGIPVLGVQEPDRQLMEEILSHAKTLHPQPQGNIEFGMYRPKGSNAQ